MKSSKIKKRHWLIFTLIVLLVCDWLIIAYWTDIKIDLSAALLIKMLLGLPVAIICVVYFVYWLIRFSVQKFKGSSAQHSETIEQTITESEASISDHDQFKNILPVHFNVLATALVTPWGDDVEIIMEKLRCNALVEPDPILKFQESYPYLTRRIATMPVLNELESNIIKNKTDRVYLTEQPLFTERAKRIEQLTAQLFKQLSLVLQSVEIKRKFTEQDESDAVLNTMRIHPAWMGQDQYPSFEVDIKQPQTRCSLHAVYLLPQHLTDIEKDRFESALTQCLNLIGIDEQYDLTCQITEVESSDDTQQEIYQHLTDHLNHDHLIDPQLLLILGADSWIDQQLLDIKFSKENKAVLPSEGGFAILLAHEDIKIDLTPLARVTAPVLYDRNQTKVERDLLLAENLQQSIQRLQNIYALGNNDQLLNTNELVLVEHDAAHIQSATELHSLKQLYNITEDQMTSIAPMLNDTRAMISGFSLSFSIKYAQEKQSNTLVINNSGHQHGTSWIVSPYKNNDQERETI